MCLFNLEQFSSWREWNNKTPLHCSVSHQRVFFLSKLVSAAQAILISEHLVLRENSWSSLHFQSSFLYIFLPSSQTFLSSFTVILISTSRFSECISRRFFKYCKVFHSLSDLCAKLSASSVSGVLLIFLLLHSFMFLILHTLRTANKDFLSVCGPVAWL